MSGHTAAKSRSKRQANDDLETKIFGLRMTKRWWRWLERSANHNRMTVASFLDRAAAEHALSTGFDESPPVRIVGYAGRRKDG